MTALTIMSAVFGAAIAILAAEIVSHHRALNTLRHRLEKAEGITIPDYLLHMIDSEVRLCRECRCTDDVACMTGCWWVEDDLCSSCADDLAASGSSLEDGKR